MTDRRQQRFTREQIRDALLAGEPLDDDDLGKETGDRSRPPKGVCQ
jgi:hypothetical protein